MDFINFHIAYLLTKHECVIIPDFGAFTVSKGRDERLKNRGFISPPVKCSLTFNPEIIRDDGLLARSVAKEKNISYTEALQTVYEYVDRLVDNLRTGQVVQFPWIGKIHLSTDRKIVFTPAKNLSCNASSCGLVNLNFPYLNEASEDESAEKREKIYKKPVFYIVLGAIVLLTAALLFIFLNLKPSDKNLFPDAATGSDTLKANPLKPAVDTLPLAVPDSVKPEIDDSVKPAVADTAELSSSYFIIISSFAKEPEAKVMLHYFVAKGLDKAKIIHSDGKYRISIETFDKKEKAIAFLDMLRKDGGNPLFKEAWILEDRGR